MILDLFTYQYLRVPCFCLYVINTDNSIHPDQVRNDDTLALTGIEHQLIMHISFLYWAWFCYVCLFVFYCFRVKLLKCLVPEVVSELCYYWARVRRGWLCSTHHIVSVASLAKLKGYDFGANWRLTILPNGATNYIDVYFLAKFGVFCDFQFANTILPLLRFHFSFMDTVAIEQFETYPEIHFPQKTNKTAAWKGGFL